MRKTTSAATSALPVIGVLLLAAGCGSSGTAAPGPSSSPTSSAPAAVTVAEACTVIHSETAAIYAKRTYITRAKDWLPLDGHLLDWEDQGGTLAKTIRPFEAAVEKRLETPDHDEYGLRIDASAADDAIIVALKALAPKCAAAGVNLKD